MNALVSSYCGLRLAVTYRRRDLIQDSSRKRTSGSCSGYSDWQSGLELVAIRVLRVLSGRFVAHFLFRT